MKRALLAAALVTAPAFLGPAAAFAQSPEEAVAYAFLGIADGATLKRATTTMAWKETKTAPATFEGDVDVGGRKATLRFIVHPTDTCHYEITIEGPVSFVPGNSRLYGRVSMGEIESVGLSADGYKADIAGSGFCETGPVNPACVSVGGPDLFGSPDRAKQKEAVDLLVATCGAKP
ncbi:MAG: hypothetical protein J0H63_01745 [Rhizobiales bacterium]|nr:hypothetical protein [Hyphomicrobiales bacterium]MBN9008892.1 hypothetical protein [Hyphomicrobiales bacterium]